MDVVTSIKAGIDVIGAILSESAFRKYRTQLREIEGSLIAARSLIFELQDEKGTLLKRVNEAEQDLVKLKAWELEKAKYELVEIVLGVFVYAPKASVQTTDPKHYLCPRCYERSEKSILQLQHQMSPPPLECIACHARYHQPPLPFQTARIIR